MALAEYKLGDRTYLFDEDRVPEGAERVADHVPMKVDSFPGDKPKQKRKPANKQAPKPEDKADEPKDDKSDDSEDKADESADD